MSVRQGKIALGALLGLAAFIAVGSLGLLVLRTAWHEYALAEPLKLYTLAMLVARLSVAQVASLAAGVLAERSAGPAGGGAAGGGAAGAWAAGTLLLLLSVPLHFQVWYDYPVWYHVVYLALLVPVTGIAGSLRRSPLVSLSESGGSDPAAGAR